MPILVIVRHGQSVWNLENRFTGNVDVDLSSLGEKEARDAGTRLHGYAFAKAFTSMLQRAIRTLDIILEENIHPQTAVVRDAALNERGYGDLQGLNKAETALKYGEQQVRIWRRSFVVAPPGGESLRDTADRVIPYYKNNIEPGLNNGQNILVVAHGNSLRALMMHLENIPEKDMESLNLATGIPRQYEMDSQLHVVKAFYL